ncbi:MAG TPA: ABC transporter permease [Acidimicrobiales bacterium]|nr:ABC transporter permease [Acidimicrobiales bacterium]
MSAVRLVFGAELRRRWRSWLTLAVLIAVVGGLVLAAAAAGRRTATAYPRFLSAHGYDYLVFNYSPLPEVARLPEVAAATAVGGPPNAPVTCRCGRGINDVGFSINDLSPRGFAQTVKLVAGRLPAPSSPDEVLASYNLEQKFGVHIGTVVHTPFFTRAQIPALVQGANLSPAGPTIALHVVGIEVDAAEFSAGTTATYDFWGTPALDRAADPSCTTLERCANSYFVRLRHGAADLPRFTAALSALHPAFTQDLDSTSSAVASAIHPQAVGWWVLAVLAGLAALATIGQAIGRQSVVESEEYPTLGALGLPRNGLVALGTARNLVVALAGAVGAVLVAFVLSPLTPVGEARLAEPSTGLSFDTLVLPLGALATVVVVLLLGVWPALRATRVQIGDDQATYARPSVVAARVAATGAPPSAVVGVRHALERGRGAATIPVGTALFGTALAVLGLCATAVFGASLSHLTATPELYGDDYQISFGNEAGQGNAAAVLTQLSHDRSVTGIMLGTRDEITVNGTNVFAVVGKAVRGPLLISAASGRVPGANGEIALGATTMRHVGAHIGSVVHVTVQSPTGGSHTAPFRVVGTIPFPSQFGLGGIGTGAAFTMGGYLDAACPAGPAATACRRAYQSDQIFAVLAKVAPGAKGRADATRIIAASQGAGEPPVVPTSLVNFGEAVNFPLILGFMLALFGVATLLHLLVVSVTRRRREMGLLKSIGFLNGQVGATVCWQATTVALVGIVVGIPVGVAVGETVWRAFAANLGAVPVAVVPAGIIVALGAGVLVVANLLAVAPALAAARSKTSGQLLRTQ